MVSKVNEDMFSLKSTSHTGKQQKGWGDNFQRHVEIFLHHLPTTTCQFNNSHFQLHTRE